MTWRLSALALSGCFLGGSSVNVAKDGLPSSFNARSAQVCARDPAYIPVAIWAEVGSATANVVFTSDDRTFDSVAVVDGDFLVTTLPSDIPPGTYRMHVWRGEDGVSNANEALLSVTSDKATCSNTYTPVVSATGGRRQVTLTWTATPGADAYVVSRKKALAEPFVEVATTGEASYVDAPLNDGATVFYRVAATGPFGRFESKVAEAATIPPQVAGVRAESSIGGVDLAWVAAPGATGYAIDRSIDETTFERIGTATATHYSDNTAEAAKPYVYRIVATNAPGEALPSNQVVGVAQSGSLIYACQQGPDARSTGVFGFDALAVGDAAPIINSSFDTTLVGNPPLDAVASGDGAVWFMSSTSMTAYVATTQLDRQTTFALREPNGDVRGINRTGGHVIYDSMTDSFVFAGAQPTASMPQQLLYTMPRRLLSEPVTGREGRTALPHGVSDMAFNPIARELIMVEDHDGAAYIHFYSADALTPDRDIFGPGTQLLHPRAVGYDAARNHVIVLDTDRLMRFDANGLNGVSPVWITTAAGESMSVDTTTGVVYVMRKDHTGVDWWSANEELDAPPRGTIALPPELTELGGVASTHLVFEPTSRRLWVSGQRAANPIVSALVPSGETGSLYVAGNEGVNRSKLGAQCAVHPQSLRTVTIDPSSSSFKANFFIAAANTGPQLANAAWTNVNLAGVNAVGSITPFKDVEYRTAHNQIILAGSLTNTGGESFDWVALFDDAAAGPTVVSSATWISDPVSSPTTSMRMAFDQDSDEVLLWRARGASGTTGGAFDIISWPNLPYPMASATTMPVNVIDVAYHRGMVYAIEPPLIRVYRRIGQTIALQREFIFNDNSLRGGQAIAFDKRQGALRIVTTSGSIVTVSHPAEGVTYPDAILRGTRTFLLPNPPASLNLYAP